MNTNLNTRKSLVLLLCLVSGPLAGPVASAFAQSGQLGWKKSTPLPEPRGGYAAGVLDGKLVIAGGTYWEGRPGNWTQKRFSASTHAFDPDRQVWERLPDIPSPFGYGAYTVLNNCLYLLGGYTGSEESDRILTLRKQGNRYVWKTVGRLPEPRLFAWAGSVGSSIYLLGGTLHFEPYDKSGTCCTTATATNDLMVWDTAEPRRGWKMLAPHPGRPRWLFAAETDGQSIWMFGGSYQQKQQDPFTRFLEAYRYRIDQGTWEELPSLPAATHDATPLVPLRIEDKILLVSFSKTVWQFNLKTLTYSQSTPLPEEAYVDKFVWLDNRIIGAGGERKTEAPRRRSDWTFIGEFAAE